MSIERILHAVLFTPGPEDTWGIPTLFWGEPGVAKTAIIKAVAARDGLVMERLSPAERGEGAFGVVPVPGEKFLTYPAPDWTAKFDGGAPGVIFVDEASCTPPAMQPPLLGLIQFRIVGSHRVPGSARLLAAANPTEDAAGGWDLAASVANRMAHFEWDKPSAPAFAQWLLAEVDVRHELEGADARAEEARVLSLWPAHWARARALVAQFVRVRSHLLHAKPKGGDPQAGRAWPSPRTWELAARALAGGELHGLDAADRDALVDACVGTGAATEFVGWVAAQDLPDPAALLDGDVEWRHDPDRLDRTHAVLGSCAALVAPKDAAKRAVRAAALWRLMGEVAKDADDIIVPAGMVLCSKRVALSMLPEARPILTKLNPILEAAGVRVSPDAA